MFGRKYQWVIMGTYTEEWWLRPGGGCDPSELSEALHGAILTDLLPLTTEERYTVSGIVSNVVFCVSFPRIIVFHVVLSREDIRHSVNEVANAQLSRVFNIDA